MDTNVFRIRASTLSLTTVNTAPSDDYTSFFRDKIEAPTTDENSSCVAVEWWFSFNRKLRFDYVAVDTLRIRETYL